MREPVHETIVRHPARSMTPDPQRPFQANPEIEREFRERVQGRSWDRNLKETVETPGRFSAIVGGLAGLMIAVVYGLMIGGTELSTVAAISAALVFIFLLVVAGEFWWALLVLATASGLRTSEFGFRMTGFEIGFVAVVAATLIRMALRSMKKYRPPVGLGLPFWALALYLVLHAALVVTHEKFTDPLALKNIVRGYYSVVAPLAFFSLLGFYCHPRTVKPVILALLGVMIATTVFAIPIWLFGLNLTLPEEIPVGFAWLDSNESGGVLRAAPILAVFAIALFPTARSLPRSWMIGGVFVLALLAATLSSGRLALASVMLVSVLFLGLNRKWGACALGALGVGMLVIVATNYPEWIDKLPKTAQRAISPMNLAHSHLKDETSLSDRWHEELRKESFDYWTETWVTFLFGHGYGRWDSSLSGDEMWHRDFDYAKKLAIQMGKTENVFSSITNIFGLTGLLLYAWFTFYLGKSLLHARSLAPPRSFEKAMCEVSIVYIAMFLILSPFAGGAPGWDLFYWQIGLLAARPLLAKSAEEAKIRPPARSRRADELDFEPRRRRPEKLAGSRTQRPVLPGRMRRPS